MWRYFCFFRLNIKSKLLNSILSFLAYTELDITRNFICIFNLDSFNYSLGLFGGNKRTKVKNSFLNKEDIGLDLLHHISAMLLARQDELFFKNRVESVSVDSRNT